MRTAAALTLASVAAAAAGACSGAAAHGAPPRATPAAMSTTSTSASPSPPVHRRPPSPSAATTPPAAATQTRTAPFTWSSSAVTAAALGKSWHPRCPVGPTALRAVTMTYWGFDAAAHHGVLVVNRSAVGAVVEAFRRIYAARFPIRGMQPIAAYGGSDDASMAADNTSAFNCRYAVSNGPKSWSEHAYGDAVDIDPLENPYRLDGRILPPAGAAYMNRNHVRPGMVVAGSAPVSAFDAVGWGWGGRWASTPDYQHFSSTGR